MASRRGKGDGSLICSRCSKRPAGRRGLCKVCAENLRVRHPDQLPPLAPLPTLEERFWSKVDKSGDCWIWTAGRHDAGYGIFNVALGDRRYAHRMTYEWLIGPIPSGMQIDHLCRVRECCNPAHLEVVTPGENYIRGYGFGGVNHRKTHCPKDHAYDEMNTYVGPKGERHCRTCRRERAQLRREAQRGAA